MLITTIYAVGFFISFIFFMELIETPSVKESLLILIMAIFWPIIFIGTITTIVVYVLMDLLDAFVFRRLISKIICSIKGHELFPSEDINGDIDSYICLRCGKRIEIK